VVGISRPRPSILFGHSGYLVSGYDGVLGVLGYVVKRGKWAWDFWGGERIYPCFENNTKVSLVSKDRLFDLCLYDKAWNECCEHSNRDQRHISLLFTLAGREWNICVRNHWIGRTS
jgi:hypothetical protein